MRKRDNMDIITRFDPAKAQKAHGDTILAGPVLTEGVSCFNAYTASVT